MIIAVHQPNYLPSLGFFYKMSRVDLFVVETNLQFDKREGWQRRHKIPGNDEDIWLTVPVGGSRLQKIREVPLGETEKWRRKHKAVLIAHYGKTQEQEIFDRLLQLYEKRWERLVDVNMAFIEQLREILGIKTSMVLDEETGGVKWELLLSFCKKYGADAYMSGMGAKDYMTQEYYDALEKEGIAHHFVDRNLTVEYPYSIIHYLLTEGREKVREILRLT